MHRINSPESSVQRPESSAQSFASRVQRPTLASRVQVFWFAVYHPHRQNDIVRYTKKGKIFNGNIVKQVDPLFKVTGIWQFVKIVGKCIPKKYPHSLWPMCLILPIRFHQKQYIILMSSLTETDFWETKEYKFFKRKYYKQVSL